MSQDFYIVQQIQELVVVFLRSVYHTVRLGNLKINYNKHTTHFEEV